MLIPPHTSHSTLLIGGLHVRPGIHQQLHRMQGPRMTVPCHTVQRRVPLDRSQLEGSASPDVRREGVGGHHWTGKRTPKSLWCVEGLSSLVIFMVFGVDVL